MAFGLNTLKVRELAYEMAVRNNIPIPNSWKINKCASKDWLRAFVKRNPTLSLRMPVACSLSRLTSFTKPNVDRFFSHFEEIYKQHPSILQDIRIYNLDETSTTTVQRPHKPISPWMVQCKTIMFTAVGVRRGPLAVKLKTQEI
ncbi:unnamed protein product [Acanthoscelides obtectus]|uniref:Transposase n=1 Tax=Acanthoscelides obtectus TaxID=200917 RepID=A0A9P0P8Q9_ACAOB|nr:unnamed protein product [Acanthoscelides obtectus]CAK1648191.1 hypothetical protein AOBTE_LOCUS15593 [Acanthoscelides obtectus]